LADRDCGTAASASAARVPAACYAASPRAAAAIPHAAASVPDPAPAVPDPASLADLGSAHDAAREAHHARCSADANAREADDAAREAHHARCSADANAREADVCGWADHDCGSACHSESGADGVAVADTDAGPYRYVHAPRIGISNRE
jgi:hypothetical protein